MKLNVGCGLDIKKGWINLDFHNKNGADVVFNLEEIYEGKKLPFENNTFDVVYCSHVLEDFIEPHKILDELVRVSKSKIHIIVPCDTLVWLNNLYHKRPFTLTSLMGYATEAKQYGSDAFIKVEKAKYVSTKSPNYYSNFCVFMRNILGYRLIEYTFLKYLFPMSEIEVIFVKTSN